MADLNNLQIQLMDVDGEVKTLNFALTGSGAAGLSLGGSDIDIVVTNYLVGCCIKYIKTNHFAYIIKFDDHHLHNMEIFYKID